MKLILLGEPFFKPINPLVTEIYGVEYRKHLVGIRLNIHVHAARVILNPLLHGIRHIPACEVSMVALRVILIRKPVGVTAVNLEAVVNPHGALHEKLSDLVVLKKYVI